MRECTVRPTRQHTITRSVGSVRSVGERHLRKESEKNYCGDSWNGTDRLAPCSTRTRKHTWTRRELHNAPRHVPGFIFRSGFKLLAVLKTKQLLAYCRHREPPTHMRQGCFRFSFCHWCHWLLLLLKETPRPFAILAVVLTMVKEATSTRVAYFCTHRINAFLLFFPNAVTFFAYFMSRVALLSTRLKIQALLRWPGLGPGLCLGRGRGLRKDDQVSTEVGVKKAKSQ